MSAQRSSEPTRLRLQTRARTRSQQAPTAKGLANRRAILTAVKLVLPAGAVLLLASIAIWPQVSALIDRSRAALGAFTVDASGRMMQPHYHGVDQRGRPYTVTADWANQVSPTRVDLGAPKGDLTQEGGHWLMVQSQDGVYIQHDDLLDLSKDVVLYRDDGTTVRTQSAVADLRQGAASSDLMTHAEGPFGVLDAQGFTLTDKGSAIQFYGPAKLVLNRGSSQ